MRTIVLLTALAVFTSHAPAQVGQVPCPPGTAQGVVCLQGQVSGTLMAGTIYHIYAGSSVPAGMSLIIQPGVIVKFQDGGLQQGFVINGTLTVNQGVILTSIYDDATGGDTNGDGNQTFPGPGNWGGLFFGPLSDASVVDGAVIQYASVGVVTNFADITLTNTAITLCGLGINLFGNSFPTVTGCSITGCYDSAFGVSLGAVPGFLNNTSNGNTFQDQMEISDDTMTAFTTTITAANAFNGNGQFIICNTMVVPAAQNLVFGPGIVIKMSNRCLGTAEQFQVEGTLAMTGVTVTSIKDDTVAGDWQKEQPPVPPAPGDWSGFFFMPGSDASVLDNVDIAYAGKFGTVATVDLSFADITMTDVVIENGANNGLDLSAGSFPTVTGCDIRNNAGIAVIGAKPAAIPGFVGNASSGNALGDYIRIEPFASTITADMTIAPENSIAQDGVFVITGGFKVAIGTTLTIDPGVKLKWVAGQLLVNGTLLADSVTMTALEDDTVGGDTNKDGTATMPAPGAWTGLAFTGQSDASALTGVVLRFGGGGFPANPAIFMNLADITMTGCTVDHCAGAALAFGFNARPTVSGCAFTNNLRVVDQLPITAIPGFSACTAAGNTDGDHLRVAVGMVDVATAIGPDATLNGTGVVELDADVDVVAAGGLTLLDGVIFKFDAGDQVTVNSVITCGGGIGGGPVVFTSIADDAFGGDTNGDGGASAPAPGDWRQILVAGAADASYFEDVVVRYAGKGGLAGELPALSCLADMTLLDVVVQECSGTALHLHGVARPVMDGCLFTRCELAVDGVHVEALPGFSNNSANMNLRGDYLRVTDGVVSSNVLVTSGQSLDGRPFVVADDVEVLLTATLTIAGGVTIKWEADHDVEVDGTLMCQGSGAPVIFTSLKDDSNGDTNKDGNATAPAPGDWGRILLQSTAHASVLASTIVRYAGGGAGGCVKLAGADVTIIDSCIENGMGDALDLSGNSYPQVTRCDFSHNTGIALDAAPLRAVGGFTDDTASGNAGNYVRITTDDLSLPAAVARHNALNEDGVFVVATSIGVAAGESLTLHRGVTFKWQGAVRSVDVSAGELHVLGTGLEPVVFTMFTDDAVGGDTNGDGAATTPVAGNWLNLNLGSGAAPSTVEHAVLRYAGSFAAFACTSDQVTARSIRAEHAAADGFQVSRLAGDAENWVACDCAQFGIDLGAPAGFDVVHATVTGCGAGIRKPGGLPGNVVSSIVWGNAGAALSGFAAGEVAASDAGAGFAGMNGNIDADPMFVDAASGDLRLAAGSPCVDTADLARALLLTEDHVEGSRVTDDDLDGTALADMGAFERAAFGLTFGGQPELGTTMSFAVDGPGGVYVLLLGILDGSQLFAPYGFYLAGNPAGALVLPAAAVNQPSFVVMPALEILAGFEFAIQGLGFPGITSVGNFTEVYRGIFFR